MVPIRLRDGFEKPPLNIAFTPSKASLSSDVIDGFFLLALVRYRLVADMNLDRLTETA